MAKLKFGSPAWRKKYMKAKRKPAKRKNSSSSRSAKAHRRRMLSGGSGYVGKDGQVHGRNPAKRKRVVTKRKRTATKANPPKLKRLTKSTGWMNARRVRIVRKGRGVTVLVEKR